MNWANKRGHCIECTLFLLSLNNRFLRKLQPIPTYRKDRIKAVTKNLAQPLLRSRDPYEDIVQRRLDCFEV